MANSISIEMDMDSKLNDCSDLILKKHVSLKENLLESTTNNEELNNLSLYEQFLMKNGQLSSFQIKLFFSACLCCFCDDLFIALLNLITIFVQQKFGISLIEKGYVNFICSLGVFISCSTVGKLTEYFTRREIMLSSLSILIVFTYLASVANSIASFCLFYFICGLCMGPLHTLHVGTVAETSCIKYRWFAITSVWTFFYFGDLYLNTILLIYCGELDLKYYDAFFNVVIVTYVIVLIICYLWFHDSPRFLMLKNKKEEAYLTLKNIEDTHLESYKPTDRDFLKNNYDEMYNEVVNNPFNSSISFADLYNNPKYFECIVRLSVIICILITIFSGFRSIFQIILLDVNKTNGNNTDTKSNFLFIESIKSSLILLPSVPTAAILANLKGMSRMKLSAISLFFSLIFTFLALFDRMRVSIYSGLMQFGIVVSFNVVYSIGVEIFPTSLRDKALSILNLNFKLLGAISSYTIFIIFIYGFVAVSIYIVILICVSAYLCLIFPLDTMNMQLDSQ